MHEFGYWTHRVSFHCKLSDYIRLLRGLTETDSETTHINPHKQGNFQSNSFLIKKVGKGVEMVSEKRMRALWIKNSLQPLAGLNTPSWVKSISFSTKYLTGWGDFAVKRPSNCSVYSCHAVFSCFSRVDCNITDCSLPGSSVQGTLQARILKWAAIPEDLPNPGIQSTSPSLQADSLSLSHQGSPLFIAKGLLQPQWKKEAFPWQKWQERPQNVLPILLLTPLTRVLSLEAPTSQPYTPFIHQIPNLLGTKTFYTKRSPPEKKFPELFDMRIFPSLCLTK